jgi:hypothetical protein
LPPLNADLVCEHDRLHPDPARRQLVGADCWNFFKAQEQHDCAARTFPAGTVVCPDCKRVRDAATSDTAEKKAALQKERDALQACYANKPKPLAKVINAKVGRSEATAFCVVATDWLARWREKLRPKRTGTKDAAAAAVAPPVGPIDNGATLLCSCAEPRLLYDPGEETKRGIYSGEHVTLLPHAEWAQLVELYGAEGEPRRWWVGCEIVCRTCVAQREEMSAIDVRCYSNATLTVKHVAKPTPLRDPDLAAAAVAAAGGDSRSRRASRAKKMYTLAEVSSEESLSQTKWKLHQTVLQQNNTEIFPNQMTLYCAGHRLEVDGKQDTALTMHECGVRADSVLELVVDTTIPGSYDGMLMDETAFQSAESELGFANTIFLS